MRPPSKKLRWLSLALALGLWACDTPPVTSTPSPPPGDETPDETPCQGDDCQPDETPDEELTDEERYFPGIGGAPGTSPCSSDIGCDWQAAAPGGEAPFNQDELDSAELNEDGHVTLDASRSERKFIWIANTGEGTISKVDSSTVQEIARYRTGPPNALDPSRTSVDSFGDVYVGNRAGRGVTKIASGSECVDKNANGSIETSTGAGDIKDWGQDECVIWHRSLPDGGIIRALAAQQEGDRAVVWVGGWDSTIWKLDGETGDVLLRTRSPVPPYGFALDQEGNLWIANLGNLLGRIDTLQCLDETSCNQDACGNDGDDCVKQRINAPKSGYGITVDFKQRVWLGGNVMRYDPAQPQGQRWFAVEGLPFVHGISADEQGYIYGASLGQGIARMDADNPNDNTIIAGTAGQSVKGVAVDLEGKVWGINRQHNNAFVVEPGPGLHDGAVSETLTGLVSPYTYSDMTGSQLRFATNQSGVWRRVFTGCSSRDAYFHEWRYLRFDADAPSGSSILWQVRVADSSSLLGEQAWIDLGSSPALGSPIDLLALLEPLNLHQARYLEVRAQLSAARDDVQLHVPVIRAVDTVSICPPIIL
ncbi:hypothetical protein DL240_05635 [Lujinxingia litoralis]|uniref:SMP-30/Gluconolactonase/LRE-like region domain-containing protein n=1 Tax=Lujinxingia litoralis TaxID=2211119 RepID=A0A328CCM1_9DELT|nr:hypothetical protein [Lujinxingia litoralis]RAL23641.1 hypothetical protein DL240_05635 [Lujinxingia litoralis]